MTTEPDAIPWLEWGVDAFARAAAEHKPVLLAIGAAWCASTDEMDRVSYCDAGVVRLVTERFIPVRIDADLRPDVSERYTLGGWPTTAFLTPSGEILGGGTYVEPAPLVVLLEQVAEAFATRRTEIDRRVAEPAVGRDTGTGPAPAVPRLDEDAGRWLRTDPGSLRPDLGRLRLEPKRVYRGRAVCRAAPRPRHGEPRPDPCRDAHARRVRRAGVVGLPLRADSFATASGTTGPDRMSRSC